MKRSPAAAVWLSLLPGAGHIYVGQIAKGFVLILLVVSAIQIASEVAGPFGLLIPFLWLYAMLDAHRSAVEVNRIVAAGGEIPRSDLELANWWGYMLIGLGALFILENFDLFDFDWIWRLWPLALIALGVYILKRKEAPTPASPPLPHGPPAGESESPAIEREHV